MTRSLVDGLGGEELGQAGSQISNLWLTGSIVSESNISGANVYSTANIVAGGDITAGSSIFTSATHGEGIVINSIRANAIISGGMWVTGSAASGTTPNYVALAGPADSAQPLGICISTTASGAVVPILTKGLYKGLVAEATLNAGVGFSAGAGTALNCAKAAAAGTTRGVVVMGAGSTGVISVWLH